MNTYHVRRQAMLKLYNIPMLIELSQPSGMHLLLEKPFSEQEITFLKWILSL